MTTVAEMKCQSDRSGRRGRTRSQWWGLPGRGAVGVLRPLVGAGAEADRERLSTRPSKWWCAADLSATRRRTTVIIRWGVPSHTPPHPTPPPPSMTNSRPHPTTPPFANRPCATPRCERAGPTLRCRSILVILYYIFGPASALPQFVCIDKYAGSRPTMYWKCPPAGIWIVVPPEIAVWG